MSMFTNTKKAKKFILVLIFLILFNFVMPGAIKADTMLAGDSIEADKDDSYGYTTSNRQKEGGFFDIATNLSKLLFFAERSIIMIVNNMFCDDAHQGEYTEWSDGSVDVTVHLTPESIIKGKFILFDPDIFQDVENIDSTDEEKYFDDGAGKSIVNGKTKLRETVAGWYYALRNLAIVALLSILVYVGIRMIISTVSQDKAKYKLMFKDWLVALCLLIAMHYIMITILDISSKLVEAIGTSGSGASQTEILMKKTGSITSASSSYTVTTADGKTYGDVRSVYINEDESGNIEGIEYYTVGDAFAFMLLLLAIIIYTVLFAGKYLIREFTLIFLVLLGPISCITYPIDKISDGKAQAFNRWFTEFLYNVIIQPFHLLIYIVLIGTATQLADDNILYSIICFAVMLPAEKFIKEMFGFKDKLGSPLGALATGAAASQLFNKLRAGSSSSGKGGNSGDGGENNSTPNNLPPKTKKDGDLVDGNTGTPGSDGLDGNNASQQTIRANQGDEDQTALPSGEEPGGSASAADAYQNSEDPVADEERAALEEQISDGQIDKSDLTEEQKKKLLGISDKDGQEDDDDKLSDMDKKENESEENKSRSLTDKLRNATNKAKNSKIMAIHNQRVSKKYGSTNRGQRWINRGKKILPKAIKGVAKGTLITGAGLVAATTALATGNVKGAFGIAAGMGAYVGKKAKDGGKKVIKGATGAFNDYRNGLRSDDSKEKKALKDFKADSKQMDKAVYSYRKNHGGQDPGYEALENEMEDRFTLSRYGLTDDQIDDALPMYQQKRDELLDNRVEEERAKEIAASQAKQAAELAKAYSAKDFRDSKTMNSAYKGLKERLTEAAGGNEKIGDEYARMYLINAAKMNSVSESEIALPQPLPSTDTTIDVPLERKHPNVPIKLGLNVGNMSSTQLERMNRVTMRLHDSGFSDRDIEIVASDCNGGSTTEVLDKYEAKLEYLNDGHAIDQARMSIEKRNGGKNATKEQVQSEMRERLVLKSTFNVKDEGEVNRLRNVESESRIAKTQIQAAREFAVKHKGQLNSTGLMKEEKQKLVDRLKGRKLN